MLKLSKDAYFQLISFWFTLRVTFVSATFIWMVIMVLPIVCDIEARSLEHYWHWRKKTMSFASARGTEATSILAKLRS